MIEGLPEKQPRDFETEINSFEASIMAANDFEALFSILRNAQVVEGTQKTYTADELIGLINQYRESFNPMNRVVSESDRATLERKITGASGLRSAVIRLQKRLAQDQINKVFKLQK